MPPPAYQDSEAYDRVRRLLAEVPLPAAWIDLDALEANIATLTAALAASGKTLRIATKSLRSPALVERIAACGGDTVQGVMTYTALETLFLAQRGVRDLLLAYPVGRAHEADALAQANAAGAQARVVVDDVAGLPLLAAAARRHAVTLPVVIDLDVSWRPLGDAVHIGVMRSPVRSVGAAVVLAEAIAREPALRLCGVMAYEAHVAGLPDHTRDGDLGASVMDAARRAMKRRAVREVLALRGDVVSALRARGHAVSLVNGGGTGSIAVSSRDASLTEVTVGSGFVDSHLFDHYDGVALVPAAFFAVEVVRTPGPGMVTCHGGGFIASGAVGADRWPVPWLPRGLTLRGLEGVGEVQTPLHHPRSVSLALGDPVVFRHAKAGELSEHVREYLLVRGDRVEARAPTYRGLGECFLG